MRFKNLKVMASAAVLSCSVGFAQAEVAVVVHPSNAAVLDAGEVAKLFLGKASKFPGGAAATPIDLAEGDASRDEFHAKVTSKDAGQLKSYWSRLVFTGKGQPPRTVASDADVISAVAADPTAIGYVDSSAVTGDVKVVLTVN